MTYTKDTLRQIFQQPFNREEWQNILRHYFHATELKAKRDRIDDTPDDEKGYYLGAIDTTDNYRIGLFYYQIQHGNVARKRVGLRNLVKSFINPNWGEFDASLVVFDSGSIWRLSFVCDIKGESTAAKRYTYVFGESDNYYNTPVGRFDALQRNGISFENIKDAFSVEALSKEFFDKYREHYADIVCYITGKRYVKEKGKWVEKTVQEPCHEVFDQFVASFKNPEKTVRDYIKKLMGRLVFIQFLQKKGWLGVPSENKDWTGGDPRFLQNKFKKFDDKDNFIDGFLEPLFNDLNSNRVGDKASPYVGKDIKIPFLNGGLFQLDEEDCTDVRLPHELLGALLDFFEQYNFTIDENDPNDAQIGVDPEMLGRVFENLLEDNKDKGAFYTPKEIVQYMCQESLIAYLQTGIEDNADRESIRLFVLTHEVEHLGSMAEDISIKLLNVKICDPAIGSGAFPMGLLRELYLCQCAIHPELEEKNAADIKRHIIQNNIYGVNIEKGAVDIARLRFWLSLIVDEDSPNFLPNLDFKIMQGNSLLEQYRGVELSKMTTLSSEQQEGTQLTWFDNMLDVLRLDLRQKLDEYYNCPDHHRKEQLKNEITDNVKQQLHEQSINVDFGELDLSANDQFTLWHTWFHDVFSRPSKEGFDIVIGNPPYIDSETMMKSMPFERDAYKETFDTAKGNWDIYIVFFELGMKMLKNQGILSFITPNKWISIGYGKALRDSFFSNLFSLCDCQKIKVFDAGNEPVISTFLKTDVKIINVSRFEDNNLCHLIQTIDKKRISKDNLGMCISDNFSVLAKIIKQARTVRDYIDVENPFSTSEAYQLIDILKDNYSTEDYKLINTGTIDPYISLWGYKTTSYLKGKYKYPTINKECFQEFFPKRMRQVSAPKIIITGMRYFECYLDMDGLYVAGKSTIILLNPKDPKLFKILLGILNSKIISFFIRGAYSTLGIGGGINFSREMVERLPLPIISHESEEIVPYVDTILLAKRDNLFADTNVPQNIIDIIVYHLYGLTYDDVLIVDPDTPITREEYDNFEM